MCLIFPSSEKLKKHKFDFLQASKSSKNMNLISCKLKKAKKRWIQFFAGWKKLYEILYRRWWRKILFERTLISKLSNTPKIIFISHLQPLQISNKAKFHSFFGKFSHLKLKSAPTQDKFLDFLQNEFSHLKWFQKAFFHWMGGKPFALARARMGTHPHSMKKAFRNHLKCENSFSKCVENESVKEKFIFHTLY